MFGKKRLILWVYWAAIILVISVTILVFVGAMLNNFRIRTIDQAGNNLLQTARQLRDLARQRYDMIQLYQFQEQNYISLRLNQIADAFAASCNQFDIPEIKRYLPVPVAQNLMLNLVQQVKFGETGYNYIMDREGRILYHAKLPTGFEMAHYPFAREIISKKNGIIRFWWKNPGETDSSERMIAYRTIFPWNWIICAAVPLADTVDSAYENLSLKSYYDYIRSLELEWEGHASILSKDYQVIAHPTYTGSTWENVPGAPELINLREGNCSYRDAMARKWYAGAAYFEPWGWILTASAREDEILRSYYSLRNLIVSGGFVSCLISLFILRWIIRRLSLAIYKNSRRMPPE